MKASSFNITFFVFRINRVKRDGGPKDELELDYEDVDNVQLKKGDRKGR